MDLMPQQWADQLAQDAQAVILDVRTPAEWAEGIIQGAQCIDIYTGQAFVEAIDALPRDASYYVYCKAGGRSAQACALMHQLGFERTFNLMGGYGQWHGPTKKP